MNRAWWAAILGGAALCVALLVLVLVDNPPPPSIMTATPAKRAAARQRPSPLRSAEDDAWMNDVTPPRAPEPALEDGADAGNVDVAKAIMPIAGYPPSGRYGQQSDDDRVKIGMDKYIDMEKLWTRGQRPRGSPAAMKAMEELLDRYPDTWRAGCAAYELGLHHLRADGETTSQRVAVAQKYFERVDNRYPNSRCDGDVSAGHMSDYALATEVYRHTDRNRAFSILDDMQALPDNETDSRGMPLRERAKAMRQNLPPALPLDGDKGR